MFARGGKREDEKMNRNPNSSGGRGGGGHHHHQNSSGGAAGGGGGGGSNSRGHGHNNHNNHNHHHNHNYNNRPRVFHSRHATPRHSPTPRHDMKMVNYNNKPTWIMHLQVWRTLMNRYENIQEDKTKIREDYEKLRFDMEKEAEKNFLELLQKNNGILKEKVEERNAMRALEAEVKREREALKKNSSPSEVKKVVEREEKVRLMKESLLDSFSELEERFSAREKEFSHAFSEQLDQMERKRNEIIRKLLQQEKRMDFEVLRFVHDMDFQWIEMERRLRFLHPSFEQELVKTKHYLSEYVEELENRHITQMEQMQQISNDCAFEKARVVHEYESAKLELVNQAKYEGVVEFLQGTYTLPDAEISLYSMNNTNGDTPQFVAQLQASLLSEKKIPPFESGSKLENAQYLIDLRDRHEDLKALAWASQKEQFNWSLSMIRKIVSHFESQDMRVYEHVTRDQYVSRLVWCPNNLLYPNVYEGSFSIGHGRTKEEATENAVRWGYNYLHNQLKKTNSESQDSDQSPFLPEDPISNLPRSSYHDIMMQCSQIDVAAPIITSTDPRSPPQHIPDTVKVKVETDYASTTVPVSKLSPSDPKCKPVITIEPEFKPVIKSEPVCKPLAPSERVCKSFIASKPEIKPEITSKSESKPAIASKPGSKPVIVSKPGSKSVIASKPGKKPVIASKPESKPVMTVIVLKPEIKPVIASKPESKPVIASEPTSKPLIESKPESKPLIKSEPTCKPLIESKPTCKPVVASEPTCKPVIPSEPTCKSVIPSEPGISSESELKSKSTPPIPIPRERSIIYETTSIPTRDEPASPPEPGLLSWIF